MQIVEQQFSMEGVLIPPAKEDTIAEATVEGRASSEGPLTMPTSKDPIKKPGIELVVINKEPHVEARTELMLVDGAEARDPQDISPGTDATIDTGPPEVSLVSKKVLLHLSQPPPFSWKFTDLHPIIRSHSRTQGALR